MMQPANMVSSETVGGSAALTASLRDQSSWKEPDMCIVAESPDVVQHPTCPQCETTGWRSSIVVSESTAVCGSRWNAADELVATGPACYIIASLREQLAMERAEVRELRLGIADVEIPLPRRVSAA